ncbi:MAG: hypothetical protein Q4E99_00755 [Bacillota bacterium]|nr:hypothetical protein [Bacillota bacterium]
MPTKQKYPETLFQGRIRWGVTPGGHVAHIIDSGVTKEYSAIEFEDMEKGPLFSQEHWSRDVQDIPGYTDKQRESLDYEEVSSREVFFNTADNKTALTFLGLAQDVGRIYSTESSDEYKDFALSVKEYVTASGRANQQKALKDLYQKADGFISKYEKESNDEEIKKERQSVLGVVSTLMKYTKGNLEVDAKHTYEKKGYQRAI